MLQFLGTAPIPGLFILSAHLFEGEKPSIVLSQYLTFYLILLSV